MIEYVINLVLAMYNNFQQTSRTLIYNNKEL